MAKIMFTRHAEKPAGKIAGVGPNGAANPEDLIKMNQPDGLGRAA